MTATDDMLIPAWVEGRLTPVDKLDVHRRGLRHPAVSVFVMCGDDVLIQRRALAKYHTPGLWANTCCTHPHWGEAATDCAARRLEEELGLSGLPLRACDTVEYRADVGGGLTEHEMVGIFMARVAARPDCTPNPAEVMDTRWIALSDLAAQVASDPARFTPWLRIYMQRHAARIFA